MKSYSNLCKVYDELIYEDIDYKAYYEKIMEICNGYNIKNENYLDLACGTGNLSRFIGFHFKNVFLVDLSEPMLMEADEKLRKEKIRAKILCQDMCDLNLNRKFDLITCSLDSTNYILEEEDLLDYFNGVREHLSEDGLFIFDINSYYKLSNVLGNNIFTYNSEDVFYVWENIFEEDILQMNLTFFTKEGQLYSKFEEEHFERAYKEEYIDEILKESGFKIILKLDDYKDENIKEETERITYVVKAYSKNN